jgi:hypothetical protein
MTEAFWEGYARGVYIAEYCIVRPSSRCGVRLVDSVILPDEPHGRAKFRDYNILAGRNVMVVQTKAASSWRPRRAAGKDAPSVERIGPRRIAVVQQSNEE